MEVREEYRMVIQREVTSHEKKLWSFTIKDKIPDVLTIKDPSVDPPLYSHSQIDEEKEGFYQSSESNYFTKKYKSQIEKEQTWGMYLTPDGTVLVRPLERHLYWKARDLVKKEFIEKDPLWSLYKFETDEDAYKELLRIVKDWLTSNQSVMAILPATKVIHGVALGSYNDGAYLTKKISQVQAFNPKVMELMNFRRFFQKKTTASLKYWNKPYYQIEVICTDETFPRNQVPSLLKGLIQGCLGVAKQINAAWAFGLSSQKILDGAYEACGFQMVANCPLYSWFRNGIHLADYKNMEESSTVSVFVKELSPDPNLKWKYYRKMHE